MEPSQSKTVAAYEEDRSSNDELASGSVSDGDKAKERQDINKQPTDLTPVKIPAKIIKTANIRIEVGEYTIAHDSILKYIELRKGYVAKENELKYTSYITNDLVLRIPKENFELLLSDIVRQAKLVSSKNIEVLDVTEEFVDIETRLNNKREVEKRYIDILKQAKTVEDILRVEESIRVIREEIESKEGRLKFLNDRISYSTINLNITQSYADISIPGFFEKALTSMENGWDGFLTFLLGILTVWPVVILIILIIFIIIRYDRKRKSKKTIELTAKK
jgi:hypothetical protein